MSAEMSAIACSQSMVHPAVSQASQRAWMCAIVCDDVAWCGMLSRIRARSEYLPLPPRKHAVLHGQHAVAVGRVRLPLLRATRESMPLMPHISQGIIDNAREPLAQQRSRFRQPRVDGGGGN